MLCALSSHLHLKSSKPKVKLVFLWTTLHLKTNAGIRQASYEETGVKQSGSLAFRITLVSLFTLLPTMAKRQPTRAKFDSYCMNIVKTSA